MVHLPKIPKSLKLIIRESIKREEQWKFKDLIEVGLLSNLTVAQTREITAQ